jgi:hypothetical protein
LYAANNVLIGQDISFICEESNKQYWAEPSSKNSRRRIKLEQEIIALRNQMERAAERHSFTSRKVVKISSRLDQKINEYMQLMKRKS